MTTPGIVFPIAGRPGDGEVLTVADGILWVRMPIPIPGLDFINLWLLEDDDGWTLVDTGLRGERVQSLWRGILASHVGGRPVTRIICTHFHPDHLGQAGWFHREFGAPLWMTMLEWSFGRMLSLEALPEPPANVVSFYRRQGLSDEAIAAMKARGYGNFGRAVEEIPRAVRRIRDGEVFRVGPDDWRVIVGTGHSPEHACLYCEKRGLLLSGDQVLPKISPHIGVYPGEPEANPLNDYLTSLDRFQFIDPEVMVLPAHGDPFRNLPFRLNQLKSHHEKRLDLLAETLVEPRQAIETLPLLFKRELKGEQTVLGLGEALAHLHYLIGTGQLVRDLHHDGQYRYGRAA
jgi:glyoxylase-like metal-dependent hydrolase (beta-lactamase superfamily II)